MLIKDIKYLIYNNYETCKNSLSDIAEFHCSIRNALKGGDHSI